MKPFKPNYQRAKLVILFSWIVIGLEVLCLLSSVLQLNLLQSWENGAYVDDSASTFNDLRETIVSFLSGAANITWMVLLMMWFYRAYANLQTRVSYPLSYSPGMVVGNFFIPFVNLYRPYKTMKEMYVDTRELFVRDGLSEQTALTTSWLGLWWAFWLISGFVSNFVLRASFSDIDTIIGYISLTQAEIVLEILNMASALFALIVIRDYSKVEPLLAELPEATAPSAAE